MEWFDNLKEFAGGGLFMGNKCDGVVINSKHVRMLWSGWNLDRLIAIAEAVDKWGMCPALFPCGDGHCPERGVDYIIHDKSCPFYDKWEAPDG